MARRLILMVEIDEVLFRYQQGHTVSAIARALGQSRVTVRKYLKAAVAAGLARGGAEEERTRVARAERAALSPRPGLEREEPLAAHRGQLEAWLGERNMTVKQAWRLLRERGVALSYSALKRYVRRVLRPAAARVTVRLETPPGQQAQVDDDVRARGHATRSITDRSPRLGDGLHSPNGMPFTPDGKTLIVGEALGQRLTAFDVQADGSLAHRRVYAQLPGDVSPDGIALDAEGNLWFANPAGQFGALQVREGGEIVERVELDTERHALMLGGPERRHLFICGSDSHDPAEIVHAPGAPLRVVEVEVLGAGVP
jgi:transposase